MRFGRRLVPSSSRLRFAQLRLELLEDRLPPGDLGLLGATLLAPPVLFEEPPAPPTRTRANLSVLARPDHPREREPFAAPLLTDLVASLSGGLFAPSVTAPVPSQGGTSGPGEVLASLAGLGGFDDPGMTTIGTNVLTNSRQNCGGGRGVIQSETAITASGNAVVVGYNDFRGFYCQGTPADPRYQVTGWAYSLDGGESFTDGGPLPGGFCGQYHCLRGDPWLGTGPDGTIYLASLYNGLANLAVLRGTVTEAGIDWSNPVLLPGAFGQFDKEAMAIDPNTGSIYVTYTRFGGPGGLWLYRSDDGGFSFQGAYPIRTGNQPQLQGSFPAIGPNSEVYVAYNMGYPNSTGVGFAVSYDFGETFYDVGQVGTIANFPVPGSDRAPAFPQIAVDTSGGDYHGTIYMVWQTSHVSGNGDVVLSRSTDGGFSWSAPLVINDDGTNALQWFPTISVDAYGYVNVFFYDRRENPGTAITNLYFAQSWDGGQSFDPNVKITEVAGTWRTSSDGAPANGDYISSLSTFDNKTGLSHSLVAYVDSRDGDPDTYFTRVTHDFI